MKWFLSLDLTKKETFLLIFILIFGLCLRLFNLPGNFYYTMDEEVMNLIQRNIVLGAHFPLIGSVSPLGTYLLPYFYYLGAAILFISNLNPLGQGVFGVILGVLTIFLVFYIGKTVFNKQAGLIASLIYSTSFLIVLFDRRWWHLSLGPILSLVVFYSLYKIKAGNIKFIYLLVGALILGWSTDYTNLILFLYTFVVWVLFKLPIRKKAVGMALLIFLLSNLPLVAFDLRHEFLNTKAFVSYLTKSKVDTKGTEALLGDRETLGKNRTEQSQIALFQPFITYSRIFYILSDLDISKQHTYCKDYILERNKLQGWILPILSGSIVLGFLFITFKKRRDQDALGYKLIATFLITFNLGILFYGLAFKGDVFEHYMSTLLPHLTLITGIVLYHIFWKKTRIALYVILILMVLLNANLLFKSYNSLGFNNKILAAKYALEKVGSDEFSLESLGGCFKWDGYYYPFLLQGRHPVKSYQDSNYSWLFDYRVSETHSKKVVVFVSQGDFEREGFWETYQKYQNFVTDRQKFGRLEVLILDNSKGELK